MFSKQQQQQQQQQLPHDLCALARGGATNSHDDDGQAQQLEEPSIEAMSAVLIQRHLQGKVYTKVGTSTLVAINPVGSGSTRELYSEAVGQLYLGGGSQQQQPQEPHVFELASTMYSQLRQTNVDQGVVLSGIAGSGKTTSQQHLVRQLIRLGTKGAQDSKIESRITAAQELMEAIGSCQTETNPSASCSSLYLELQFKSHGRLFGAKFLPFMLNRDKVISGSGGPGIASSGSGSGLGTSNYHIFYVMQRTISAVDRKRLKLTQRAADYRYLPAASTMASASAIHPSQRSLTPAFSALGFKPKSISRIWQVLAAILHIGNLEFMDSDQDGSVMATIPRNRQLLEHVADLLGVESDGLLQALVYKRKMITGDMCTVVLDPSAARNQCDSLATSLYSLLFAYLVEAINKQLCRKQDDLVGFIGILDTPGFAFKSPAGFETFCNNFSNEMMQAFLQHKIFVEDPMNMSGDGLELPLELEMSEQIQDTAELLCGLDSLTDMPPRGIFKFLHEAASSDTGDASGDKEAPSLLPVLNRAFSTNPSYISGSSFASSFGICHFAGQVSYHLDSFAVKNKDMMSADIVTLFQTSTSPFMQQLLQANSGLVLESHPRSKGTIVKAQLSTMPLRQPSMSRAKSVKFMSRKASVATVKSPTTPQSPASHSLMSLTKQLHLTLRDICSSLEGANLHQVVHISPNNRPAEGVMECDPLLVQSQVGSFELGKLAQYRAGAEYSVSMEHGVFLKKYRQVLEQNSGSNFSFGPDAKKSIRTQCLEAAQVLKWQTPKDVAVGQEFVWMSYPVWKQLDDAAKLAEQTSEVGGGGEQTETLQSSTMLMAANRARAQSDASEATDVSHGSQDYETVRRPRFADYETHQSSPSISTNIGNESMMMDQHDDDDEERQRLHAFKDESSKSDIKRKPTLSRALRPAKADESVQAPKPRTKTRRTWVSFVWANTFWIPSFFLSTCGGMKRPDVQMAWREKVTLCLIVLWMSAFVMFFIVGLPKVMCPDSANLYDATEVGYHNQNTDFWVSIYGVVYDITTFAKRDHSGSLAPNYPSTADYMSSYAGTDLTYNFPVDLRWACPGLVTTGVLLTPPQPFQGQYMPTHGPSIRNLPSLPWYSDTAYWSDTVLPTLTPMKKGKLAIPNDQFRNATGTIPWAMINNKIYDLTLYMTSITPPQGIVADPSFVPFLDKSVVDLFLNNQGQDITKQFNALGGAITGPTMTCLDNAFYAGVLDDRKSAKCQFGNWILVGASALMCAVVLIKFLAALQLSSKREPITYDKFVICQVPCYTEGEESLRKTLESLAALQYDDKRKLLMVISDGMIVGSGNDLPTPKIVLDVLGWKPPTEDFVVEPVNYKALGIGGLQLNSCKVYSGLYDHEGHLVPYVVVVKVGQPNETSKPGNRGKRDSQLILMNFLNSIHTGKKMCPLELEMFHHIKNVIGVHPKLYEYILQVDADTEVMPDSLNRLVAVMVNDSKVIGLCGETMVANEDNSFTTMIQVYEYYISHHLAKAFESMFGSVTCLPGCFSMYRIYTLNGKPLIVSSKILDDYSDNDVDTLHKKNLLSLGEDRYLTTLMMKYFPQYKLKFTPDALCKTVAPDKWKVLLSQRRRWINSTIHNLGELMFLSDHCGFCCFSMRFIVLVDLLGTLLLPISFAYLVYLIVVVATGHQALPMVALIMLAVTYGLQMLIFILKGAWQHIGWMIIYIIAMPLFSVFIPVYSFWHFDDFSWGNTRQVVDSEGRKLVVVADAQTRFDETMVPLKSLEAFEKEMAEQNGYDFYDQQQQQQGLAQQQPLHAADFAAGFGAEKFGGSVYGGGPPESDYYRDSNAIEMTAGRPVSRQSAAPWAGNNPRAMSPAQFYSVSNNASRNMSPAPGGLPPPPSGPGGLHAYQNSSDSISLSGMPIMTENNGPSRMLMVPSPLPGQQQQPQQIRLANSPDSLDMGRMSPMLHMQQQQQQASPAMMVQQQQQMMMHQWNQQVQQANINSSPLQPPSMTASTLSLPHNTTGSPIMMSANLMSTPLMQTSTLPLLSTNPQAPPPTDAAIVHAIHDMLATVDLSMVTKKKVRQELEAMFGVDLTTRREFISRATELEVQNVKAQRGMV